MARVQVSDETWTAFRAGLKDVPVSVALGELVRREVGRHQRRSAADADSVRIALDDARELAGELASLITRLERATQSREERPERNLGGVAEHSPWASERY